jgi:nicotinamidase-related amidase
MALVVYDMQVGVLNQLADPAPVIERVGRVLSAARAGGFPVFFMRHYFLPHRLTGVFGLRMAMAWQQVSSVEELRPMLTKDSQGFAITPELQPRADEAVFDKVSMSAFEGTPLGSVMRDLGLTSYAIVGVATEIGIEPTVRHGTDLGLIPVVVADACGGGDQAAQRRAFEGFAFAGDAMVTDVDSIAPLLSSGADTPQRQP